MSRHGIGDIIRAIASGGSVEWDLVELPSAEASLQGLLQQLRLISRIAEVHGMPSRAELDEALDQDPDNRLKQWGPLTVLEPVGQGSHGHVYRAWDARLEREVALKLLPIEASEDEPSASVIAEARLLARVRHPNVAAVYGADRIEGRTGMWIEFVNGRDLEDVVQEDGPLSTLRVCEIGRQLSDALAAVHEAGLLHRDIKARNVMCEPDGRLVLTDFGAGRTVQSEQTGTDLVGTPMYLAPEIFDGRPATTRSDIYSLGVLLYHLLTARYPITGRTVRDIHDGHRSGRRATLRDARPDLPDALLRVIDRALSSDPEKRYATARALGETLLALDERGRLRNRAGQVLAVLGAMSLLVGFGITVMTLPRRDLHNRRPEDRARQPAFDARSAVATSQMSDSSSSRTEPAPAAAATVRFRARDRVLVAKFENETGERVLDDTLEFALERELSNSTFVNVVPRPRVEDALQSMGLPRDTNLSVRLGREMSLRDRDIRVLITGRVQRRGSAYLLSVQIVNPNSGTPIATLEEEGVEGALLSALSRQALRLRERLGETLSVSQKAAKDVMLPNLRALHQYSQAAVFVVGDPPWKLERAEQALKQAIADDPAFALPQILLAWAIHDQQRSSQEFMPYANRAVALANKTNAVERLFILGSYHSLLADTADEEEGVRQRHQAIAAYEALLRIKPDHEWGIRRLLVEYRRLRQESEATELMGKLADARPANVPLQLATIEQFLRRGDVTSARRFLRHAETLMVSALALQNPDWPFRIEFLKAKAVWVEQDGSGVSRVVDEIARRAASEPLIPTTISLVRRGLVDAYVDLGRFADARRLAESSPPVLREPLNSTIFLTTSRLIDPPDVEAARQYWSTRLLDIETASKMINSNFRGIPTYIENLVQAGAFDEIRKVVAWARENNRAGPPSNSLDVEGQLAMIDGRTDEAIRLFQLARAAGAPLYHDLRMALVIADVRKSRGQIAEGIGVLEDSSRGGWSECAMYAHPPYCVAHWLRVRDLLSDLYRRTGRIQESQAVDAQLFKLLAVADADHPVLAHLRARKEGPQ
jgi:tetratricopeptide (TPR) repeat protein